jgi:hypothetical protein
MKRNMVIVPAMSQRQKKAKFVRKLKSGPRKYKGKIPIKCFNCGRIGQFFVKCPYAERKDSDDDE